MYDRTLKHSLLLEAWEWLKQHFAQLMQAIARNQTTSLVVKYTTLTLALLIVGAIVYRLLGHYRETRGTVNVRFGTDDVADLWTESERAASRGDFTTAAHLLYAALVRTLTVRVEVRYHSSKTTGDYVRELRRRGGVLVAPFTEFVREYEVVVYRDGTCDAERYRLLRHLAEPVVRPQQAAA